MRYLLALAVLVVAGCNSPTSPDLPSVGQSSPNGLFSVSGQFTASTGAIVEQRWAEVQACAGSTVSIRGISFVMEPYTVDSNGAASIAWREGPAGGYFLTADRSVHVVGSDAWSVTWKHELLHLWLDRVNGDADGGHTNALWGGGCV